MNFNSILPNQQNYKHYVFKILYISQFANITCIINLEPVTPLQILPTNEPDDVYTIQNNNLKFAAKLAFSISPTSSAQPTHQLA